MEPIRSDRDIRIWQHGMAVAEMRYRLTVTFPDDELFGTTSQIRRAFASIPENIVDGYGRGSRGDSAHFLKVARGSLRELETQVMLTARVALATDAHVDVILSQCDDPGRMLAAPRQARRGFGSGT